MTSSWIQMGQAGKLMGMTPNGAKARLQRMQEKFPVKFVRKIGGRWEVNVEILRQLTATGEDYLDEQLTEVRTKVKMLDNRVTALRDVGKKFRKNTEKRLDDHDRRLAALKQLAVAANLVVESFSPAQKSAT